MTSTEQAVQQTDVQPWYRQGWPWFLISIPFTSIILSFAMLYLALQTNNSLVVGDYYKQGKAINQRIERDRIAMLLGMHAILEQAPDGLVLQLDQEPIDAVPDELLVDARIARDSFQWPDSLQVRWVHVTQSDRDFSALFQAFGRGRYVTQDALLPGDGVWRIHIQAAGESSWRLVSQRLPFPASANIDMMPMDAARFTKIRQPQ
ncbi:MAG: FixH family protein [Granulosicoccus sp.]